MKKFILPIILLLTVLVLIHSKADAQSLGGQDCTYENYYKESNKCLKVSGDCLKACLDQAKGSYLDEVTPSDKYSACVKSNDCHGKQSACGDQTWAEYLACKNASKSSQSPSKEAAKEEVTPVPTKKSAQSDFSAIDSYVGLIWQQISRYLNFDNLEGILEETILHSVGKKSQREKEAEYMSRESYKAMQEAAAQKRLEKPEFFPATGKEEFIFVTYLDKPDVVNQPINVLDRDDIKVYPWGEGNGAAIQSSDWENIKFREPVEVDGITSHVLELEQGAVEVKVKNDNPSENKFGVDAGWLGVTVSRTHFYVSKDPKKNVAIVEVYEGEVEVKTRDGKTVKVSPEDGEPGVLVVTKDLSVIKLFLASVVFVAIVVGIILIVRKKFTSKGLGKKKR